MPTTIFDVSPAPATSPSANGDVSIPANKPNLNAPVITSPNGIVGTEILKGGWRADAMFARFEPNLDEGSKVIALRINLTSNGVKGGNFIPLCSGGWVNPQSGDPFARHWQLPQGVAKWNAEQLAPLAQYWNGTILVNDPTVWHGGAPAFSGKSMVTLLTAHADWSIGDGITGFNNVTGLAAHLDSYLLAQEALRGTGDTVDGIPCMFHMMKINAFVPGFTDRQGFKTSDHVTAADRPTLEIEWEEPIASEAFVTVLGDAALNMDIALESESAVTVLGDAALNMALALEAEAVVAVLGDADLTFLDQGVFFPVTVRAPLANVVRDTAPVAVIQAATSQTVSVPAPGVDVQRTTTPAPVQVATATAIVKREV